MGMRLVLWMEATWFPTLQVHEPYNDKVVEAQMEEAVVIDMSQLAMKERLQRVSFAQLLKLNKPDWYLVLIGVVFSAAIGCLFPLMATFFGDVLGVCGMVYEVHEYHFIYIHRYLAAQTLKILKMVLGV